MEALLSSTLRLIEYTYLQLSHNNHNLKIDLWNIFTIKPKTYYVSDLL